MLDVVCRFDSVKPEGGADFAPQDEMSRWAAPQHSKKRVNWAGSVLINPDADIVDTLSAYDIISNWRSAHGFPLNTFQTTLRVKGRQVDKNCIVAQRVKRLSSIDSKLRRYDTMTLSQMQDIGGCRLIVGSAKHVDKIVQSYLRSDLKHKLHTNDNYMMNPKPTGYRGVHLIYRYNSDKIQTYNSLKIEMQFRSQLQHAWATAVEIVGTFTRQALKSSQGEEDWLRFFALMGSALAMREGTALVPGTPVEPQDLNRELNIIAERLDAVRRLQTYGNAPAILEDPGVQSDHFFLLELDMMQNSLRVTTYKNNQLDKAAKDYLDAEKRFSQSATSDAVLVSVESLAALRRAYPNYFLDTSLFVELVEDALRGI